MTIRSASKILFLLAVFGFSSACAALQNQASAQNDQESSRNEQARQKILSSLRWTQAKMQFDEWLSIQTVYDENQIEALQSDLRNQIAFMSADELESFLTEMEAKLAVLMSPASMDARRWAAQYTKKAQQKILKKYNVQDPLTMPAADIESALRQFAAERGARQASSEAFNRARASQARAVSDLHKAQRQAAIANASRRPAPSSAYAPRNKPRNPKVYESPYPSRFRFGPWGGAWRR